MGWRPLREDEKLTAYELPNDFRNVGDAVFLHDLARGVKIALDVLHLEGDKSAVQAKVCRQRLNGLDSSQAQVAGLILERWDGLPRAEAEENLLAGSELLCRVTARRFYKAVFRNLPNSKNEMLRCEPEQLAETFKDAIVRFQAERKIEERARLRRGSVVIHCPRRITAQKVANVLLVFPTEDGSAEVPTKLRDISTLDPKVFKAHEDAILAVEKMYESMWRLVVYVSPEAMAQYPVVMASAGKVVFDTMDYDSSYPDEEGWENDKHLATELQRKFGYLAMPSMAEPGAAVPLDAPPATEARANTEKAIADEVPAVDVNEPSEPTRKEEGSAAVHAARRQRWIMTVRRAWRGDVSKETPRLVEFYDNELGDMAEQGFEDLIQRVDSVCGSVPKNRRPRNIEDFLKTVIEMRDGGSGPLFNKE